MFMPLFNTIAFRLIGTEEPDTGPTSIPKQFSVDGKTSIHPNALVKIMKQNQVTMENEEEYLEHKGGFLKQGWFALKLLKEKVPCNNVCVTCAVKLVYFMYMYLMATQSQFLLSGCLSYKLRK